MNFNTDFIPQALRTESTIAPITINRQVFTATIDACVIIGNLTDMIKKKAAYNKPIPVAIWNEYVLQLTTVLPLLTNLTDQSFVGTEVIDVNTRLFHGIFGQFTEATELMEALQTAVDTGGWDNTNIEEELFDGFWYSGLLLDELGADMDDILNKGIRKLKARYPDKYNDESAINRDLVAERKILES